MSLPLVLVTGANGQLGKEIRLLAATHPNLRFIFADRNELPVDDVQSVNSFFANEQPACCINCAAFTAVDKAETERVAAMQINAHAVGILANACYRSGSRFLHVSTDYVFDGSGTRPYREDDITRPVNYYGTTKLEGERQAFSNNPDSVVIRTSWVYSPFGNNFVKTMMRLMAERSSLNVVNDQVGSPTCAADLAEAILLIVSGSINGSEDWIPGIYHYSNEGIISWFDFAEAIRELTHSNCMINPIPSSQFPTPAKRPAYSVFSKEKIRAAWKLPHRPWRESLQKAIALMQS